MNKQIWLSILR